MKKGWRVIFIVCLAAFVAGCSAAGRSDDGAGETADAGGAQDGGYVSADDDGAWDKSERGTDNTGGVQAENGRGTDDGAHDGNERGTRGLAPEWQEMKPEGTLPLSYATQFQADFYEGGYSLITIEKVGRFLVVPKGRALPEALDEDITVLQQPLDRIYLVATSAMDFFRVLDGIGNIRDRKSVV